MSVKKSNAPIRGLAMILIAVGIILAIWGIFTVVGHKETSSNAESSSSTSQPATPAPETTPPPAPAEQPGQPANPESPAPPAPPAEGQDQPAPSPAPAPARVPVSVLNNSTIPKLADHVSGDLRADGWQVAQVGNFSDANLPESAVYFTPGNAAEEKTAQDVAAKLGIAAQPRTDAVRTAPPGVVVIITKDLHP